MAKRKGQAKGKGRGYKNLPNFPKDPKVHSDSARGRKQPQRIPYQPRYPYCNKGHRLMLVDVDGKDVWDCPICIDEMKKLREETQSRAYFIPTEKMVEEVRLRVKMISDKLEDDNYVVEWNGHEDVIEIRTDGRMYEALFDPSDTIFIASDEQVYDELNIPKDERRPYDPYQYQEKFQKWLDMEGWEMELYGHGIIHLYPKR